ncbi:MAG: type 4a pilus biogenesis protein PilO [Verrucomicrobia bacterium]|nr:type 4a pilus biogenesis protein PilO [Deltaproteobacteria bacterium]
MTRRNKLIILAAYLLILAIALPLYRLKRNSADKRLRAEISATENELAKIKAVALEMDRLRRLFPAEAGTASFIEDLYTAAQQSKLSSHDASSENTAPRSTARGAAQSNELSSFRFKINVEGSYRSIAEYIRRVQNFERFKRITDIKLAPGKQGVTGSLSLELFSLKGQNAR